LRFEKLEDRLVLTPAFSKVFVPATIGPRSASSLEYTIDNSPNGPPVSIVSFPDSLPADVTIATPAMDVLSAADASDDEIAWNENNQGFIVNSTGDGSDDRPGDGVCDTVAMVGDDAECTLRAAIQEANASANLSGAPDRIHFDIAGSGPHTITPGSMLPTIGEAVVIDGTTEPDFNPVNRRPVVELNGTSAGAGANGLTVAAGGAGSTIRGLAINRFDRDGIQIDGGGSNTIEGNFVGTDTTGTVDRGNGFYGVSMFDSTGNRIGGTTPEAANVLSGNGRYGVLITSAASTGNVVEGNMIGTNAAGDTAIANDFHGVLIQGGATGNTIGGTTASARNVISGNGIHGVRINAAGTTGNVVAGNLIGTDATGSGALPNVRHGVEITGGATGNTVGGTASGAGNVISGNTLFGVLIGTSGTSGNMVEGNLIGTNAAGDAVLGNLHGVLINGGATGNTIGGTTAGAGNVISGNMRFGVIMSNPPTTGNVVMGNLIGTNPNGDGALRNDFHGVVITGSASGNTIGGTAADAENVISGNGRYGVVINTATATGNVLEGNLIGTNAAGTGALGNGEHGVVITLGAHTNTIGGTAADAGNVISGNSNHGVFLSGNDNLVYGNLIGTNASGSGALGNAGSGVLAPGTNGNQIGGAAAGAGNVIAYNGVRGVVVSFGGTDNAIRRNSIHDNGGATRLGIDLNNDNATANDAGDPDTGANNLQNFPEMVSATINGANLDIVYSVPSTGANSSFPLTVEFFLADGSGAEGETYLGTHSYTEGTTPTASIARDSAVAGSVIVATATDDDGNTSEFSASVTVTSANSAPTLVGEGIPDVVVQKDGDPQPTPLNLLDYFTDLDGDTLTFDIDDPGNDINSESIAVDLTGNTLTITYEDYAAAQDRTPSTIVVTATDPHSESVTSTFTVTVNPVQTVEVELVVLITATPEAQAEGMTSLPASVSQVTVGQSYVVEIWMKDLLTAAVTDGPVTEGLAGAAVDLNFDKTRTEGIALNHDGVYEAILPVGEINNADGVVEGFGGGTFSTGFGIEPSYVRLGYVDFAATAVGLVDYELDLDDSGRTANLVESPSRRAEEVPAIGTIDTSQISLGSTSVMHVAGSALYGTQVGNGVSEGTGIYMTLVKDPTVVDTDGQVAALPQSESWIDEWDSYWVELWVNTVDGPGVALGSVDLTYNTAYFTATEIDHGPVYVNDTLGSIDDPIGLVSGLGGSTTRTDIGGSGFALLGRVKFESLANDQLAIDADIQFVGPYDLGLDLVHAHVEVAGHGAVEAEIGRTPDTELWAVVYDTDDDGRIGLDDFAYLADAFRDSVAVSDSPFVLALDFDRNGRIDFGDFAHFAANLRGQKGAGQDVKFPSNFTQRWVGSLCDVDGTLPTGELLDAATEIWREALGLEEPIDVQLVVREFADSRLGEAEILAVDDEGRPVIGRVFLDSDANGLGWYSNVNEPVAADKYDLYTVLVHEIGHTLGFTQAYAGFASHVQTDTDGGTIFVGPDFTARLDTTAQHLDPQANRNDLMNPELEPGVRKGPSLTDVKILKTSYETARNGVTGFTADLALHVAIEPTRSTPDVFAQQHFPYRRHQAFTGCATYDIGTSLGSRGNSSGTGQPSSAQGFDAVSDLAITKRQDGVACNPFQKDGWTDDKAVIRWIELERDLHFSFWLLQSQPSLTSETSSIELTDAVFAQWE